MIVRLINHGGKDYQEMLLLRLQVLLDPIGIPSSFINQGKEKNDFLVAAFENDKMVGCCVLTAVDTEILQLRQMAVKDNYQGKGIGKEIINFAEKVALENNFKDLMMHARNEAVPFYKKSGYAIVSEPFSEVGIVHYKMRKRLV